MEACEPSQGEKALNLRSIYTHVDVLVVRCMSVVVSDAILLAGFGGHEKHLQWP